MNVPTQALLDAAALSSLPYGHGQPGMGGITSSQDDNPGFPWRGALHGLVVDQADVLNNVHLQQQQQLYPEQHEVLACISHSRHGKLAPRDPCSSLRGPGTSGLAAERWGRARFRVTLRPGLLYEWKYIMSPMDPSVNPGENTGMSFFAALQILRFNQPCWMPSGAESG